MRNNKHKWSFYNLPTRSGLSTEEVLYWSNTLKKILKIGLEFEYNLPEKKNGTCKGDSKTCPCVRLTENNDCWIKCAKEETCPMNKRSIDACLNKTGTCEEKDCIKCEHFKSSCSGIFCSNFVGYCSKCDTFNMNCQNCAFKYDPERNPESIRNLMIEELKPNNTYGQVSKSGVHSVITDGSLLGKKGAEIITVGRRVDYWEFYNMASNIIDLATKRGAYLNERCSIHMHALASYYGKMVDGQEDFGIPAKVNEMERDMPEIILANLHQLIRRYQNAITWMTTGLSEQDRMTRWEKFRVSVLPISAIMNHMLSVKDLVSAEAGGNKYGWINYNNVRFSKEGNVNRFHVEFRATDGLNSPSAVAAISCLYYAIIIKAVEISRYGVVEMGDENWLEQAKTVKATLMNNKKGYGDGDRFSDTSKLHKYYDILITESLDLVHQLKAILIKVGPAYEVLEKLAERPCSLRLVNGETWEQIEKELKVIVTNSGKLEIALNEIITLNQISECNSVAEWVQAACETIWTDPELGMDKPQKEVENLILDFIEKKREDGELLWSKTIGAPILI